MSALLFPHFQVTNAKLINGKIPELLQSQNHMDVHIFVFVISLLCCKYMCDIYLRILDFNGLCKFSNIFINKITEDIQQL